MGDILESVKKLDAEKFNGELFGKLSNIDVGISSGITKVNIILTSSEEKKEYQSFKEFENFIDSFDFNRIEERIFRKKLAQPIDKNNQIHFSEGDIDYILTIKYESIRIDFTFDLKNYPGKSSSEAMDLASKEVLSKLALRFYAPFAEERTWWKCIHDALFGKIEEPPKEDVLDKWLEALKDEEDEEYDIEKDSDKGDDIEIDE